MMRVAGKIIEKTPFLYFTVGKTLYSLSISYIINMHIKNPGEIFKNNLNDSRQFVDQITGNHRSSCHHFNVKTGLD